jgi:hypothetical protein
MLCISSKVNLHKLYHVLLSTHSSPKWGIRRLDCHNSSCCLLIIIIIAIRLYYFFSIHFELLHNYVLVLKKPQNILILYDDN